MRNGGRGTLYGRRQTGISPAHLSSESGLGLLSQSESMSFPSPSLSLPIADRLRPDRATLYVHRHIHIHDTQKNKVRDIKRERYIGNMQNKCREGKKRKRIKGKGFKKHNYDCSHCSTPVILVPVIGSFFLTVSGNGIMV